MVLEKRHLNHYCLPDSEVLLEIICDGVPSPIDVLEVT